jgi:hypothetical protein
VQFVFPFLHDAVARLGTAFHAPLISRLFPVVGSVAGACWRSWAEGGSPSAPYEALPARIAPRCLVPGDFSRRSDASGARISTPRI